MSHRIRLLFASFVFVRYLRCGLAFRFSLLFLGLVASDSLYCLFCLSKSNQPCLTPFAKLDIIAPCGIWRLVFKYCMISFAVRGVFLLIKVDIMQALTVWVAKGHCFELAIVAIASI